MHIKEKQSPTLQLHDKIVTVIHVNISHELKMLKFLTSQQSKTAFYYRSDYFWFIMLILHVIGPIISHTLHKLHRISVLAYHR